MQYDGSKNIGFQLFFLDGDLNPAIDHRVKYSDLSSDWKHYIWTFDISEDCDGNGCIRFDNDRSSIYTDPTKVWIKNVKLEKGNKSTDYTEAPEDIDIRINNTQSEISSVADNLQTNLDNKQDKLEIADIYRDDVSLQHTVLPNKICYLHPVAESLEQNEYFLEVNLATDDTQDFKHYFMRFSIPNDNFDMIYIMFFDSITWYGGNEPEWQAGKTYEISIIDGLAMWAEF